MLCPSARFGKRQTSLRCVVAERAGGAARPTQFQIVNGRILTTGPEFQALEAGRDVEADLALQAERLERDRIVGAADQHVAADTDAERRAALRARVIAG